MQAHPIVPFLALASLTLAAPLAAQTGPWTDGELLLRVVSPAQQNEVYRIDPDTGAASLLISPSYWGSDVDSMVYDPYRGGVLMNLSLPPDSYAYYRLVLVDWAGNVAPVAELNGLGLQSITPAAEGRVYFQQVNPVLANAEIHYIDAANQRHVLLDASGTAPFVLPVRHMVHHPESNALIVSMDYTAPGVPCTATGVALARLPLSPNGDRVVGPVTCVQVGTQFDSIVSLDLASNGLITATRRGSSLVFVVDPVTLATAPLAQPNQSFLHGGVFSERTGQVIVEIGGGSNELRRFSPWESGNGTLLPTSIAPGPASSGFGPGNALVEINLRGRVCPGSSVPYGTGTTGSWNVPRLGVCGCATEGRTISIMLDHVGGPDGIVLLSLFQAATPFAGGTLLVDPNGLWLSFPTAGNPGNPGGGYANLPIPMIFPFLIGIPLYLQGVVFDTGATGGTALTNGVQLTIG